MKFRSVRLVLGVTSIILTFIVALLPSASAQSPQVEREWALFNQILMIGIVVGIVVFGLLFYAIIRYREKPERKGAQ